MRNPDPGGLRPLAVLLDLDETLVVEDASVEGAFRAVADVAAARADLDPAALAVTVRRRTKEIWWGSGDAAFAYGRRVGVSSWEALGGALAVDGGPLASWTVGFQQEVWATALLDHGVEDLALAEELAERYPEERNARQRAYPDAAPALAALAAAGHPYAVVTNGAPGQQRRKIELSGLADRLPVVVVSGDVGAKKPAAAPFEAALAALGVVADRAVMVGDSLEKDVAGAQSVGIRGVWINRSARARDGEVVPDAEIAGLAELPGILA
jgi:putative hydrolase of the HAD superfamily